VIIPTIGAAGSGLTVIVVTADGRLWQPLASVTLTEKSPAVLTVMLRVVAPLDHRYKVLNEEVRVTLLPAHIAVPPEAVIVGVAGNGLTTMVVASEG
jgi:hypothetical protein